MNLDVRHVQSKSILTRTSGFLNGYTHSLNPYTGCAYGCSFCYVRQMPIALFRTKSWGEYVDVKQNANALLEKELVRAKKKEPVFIFMSSSTDPYQPIEMKAEITRSILTTLIENRPAFLFVQTRSPIVQRDLDLFKELKDQVFVSMTVETDDDRIRKQFTPNAPAIRGRLKALEKLATAGIPTQAAVAPLLPSTSHFPSLLADYVERVCIDDFFLGDGSGGKRTSRLNIRSLYDEKHVRDWYDPSARDRLKKRFLTVFKDENVRMNQDGFLPPAHLGLNR
ncbi:radical SAM protein [Geomicrobium sp. JCM 19037]|uniref:SPL family radical SAM protein n=1 Tax=Geomicrobium sp. JCM 19037 TaxID=1460634 RepID=UPI0005A9BC64|nr:radical SAM protein [Geomicrobium sp. JCM 19037]